MYEVYVNILNRYYYIRSYTKIHSNYMLQFESNYTTLLSPGEKE